VQTDGVSLAIHRVGRGAPVVCLAAIGHDAHDFNPLAERISQRFELIAVEWPGHGQSGDDSASASASRYADLLVDCLDQLALESPIILGNSIGGAAAIICASRRPVRGLALCSSGGLVEITPLVRRITRAQRNFFAAGERGAWWFGPAFWLMYCFILTERPAAAQRRRIIAGGRKRAGIFQQAWTSFGEPAADLRDLAAKLDVPIWAAWARKEITIPLRFCLPAIKRFRQGALSTFKCGHAAFLEQPDAFAREFLAFADRLEPSRRDPGRTPIGSDSIKEPRPLLRPAASGPYNTASNG
jgi:4,5:9,10-diseco-3-hydroxy-5,9,17-trioxoandrosta-1(10),2-diene-4-oate hydrolase